jgi:hypothetical protein
MAELKQAQGVIVTRGEEEQIQVESGKSESQTRRRWFASLIFK